MAHPLLDRDRIDELPDRYLRTIGQVFKEFSTQDSGNISYGIQVSSERYFVKTAGNVEDPRPLLDHAERVTLLRNAVRLNAGVSHPLLPRLQLVIESPYGPLLIYVWVEGELLSVPRAFREHPDSSLQRFRALPASRIQACLDQVFDLHVTLAAAGWIASDFYDGCLIYDFAMGQLWVVDLDTYRDAPFRNEMGRMFGSTRFMAPKEFEKGAMIDERTTVFVMGRTALIFLSDGSLSPDRFRGSRALFEVAVRACDTDRSQRYETMASMHRAWRAILAAEA